MTWIPLATCGCGLCRAMRWVLVGLGVLALAAVLSAEQRYSFTFYNESSWDIRRLYMSASTDSEWGEDRLGRTILERGQSYVVPLDRAGRWDLRLVDEDDDVCIVSGVRVAGHEAFTIESDWLLACQRETQG